MKRFTLRQWGQRALRIVDRIGIQNAPLNLVLLAIRLKKWNFVSVNFIAVRVIRVLIDSGSLIAAYGRELCLLLAP
jgi:hypothetical protein